ncbi:MAG: helix-turn-helix transcriptional regulator [Candidatus Eremiobacteraeota bacterium]|nr:helix-turn-helix transcriptional regulator [Candidatus Eremiobacteraeota bacterium]MBV8245419.1 helix-turn-helix transcriptional regulator [Candidatus Eremiobacteraeota bacterium]
MEVIVEQVVTQLPRPAVPALPQGETCPVQSAIASIADKWKLLILIELTKVPVLRFKELQRQLGTVSQKVLTSALRDLEADGLVERKVYAEVPPRVEYRATSGAHELLPILSQLHDWAVAHSLRRPKPHAVN